MKLNTCIKSLRNVFLFTLLLSISSNAFADVDVLKARIDRIGMFFPNETRGAMIQLTDMSTSPAWFGTRQFFLSQTFLGKEGLAIALTSFSLGKTVFARIAGGGEALSLVTVIYVNEAD